MAEPAEDRADRPPGWIEQTLLRVLCQRSDASLAALLAAAELRRDPELRRLVRQVIAWREAGGSGDQQHQHARRRLTCPTTTSPVTPAGPAHCVCPRFLRRSPRRNCSSG